MKCLVNAFLIGILMASGLQAKENVKPRMMSGSISVQVKQGVPNEIDYQGWLGNATDTTGVNDTLDMKFRLYNTETGGTELWNETRNNVIVSRGIFNVILGSVTSIPTDIFTGAPLWLETQVGSDTLLPRKKLVSVGYAIRAEKSDSASNATYADTADYAVSTGIYYVDSAKVSAKAWSVTNDAGVPDSISINNGRLYAPTGAGNVGIGTTTPSTKLEVNGQVKITGGTPGAGKVLASDANGLASWQALLAPTFTFNQVLFYSTTATATYTVPAGKVWEITGCGAYCFNSSVKIDNAKIIEINTAAGGNTSEASVTCGGVIWLPSGKTVTLWSNGGGTASAWVSIIEWIQ